MDELRQKEVPIGDSVIVRHASDVAEIVEAVNALRSACSEDRLETFVAGSNA